MMRCFIKEFFHYQLFDKLYQNEKWDFTGRIKYQRESGGSMVVSFEVTMMEYPDDPEWYTSYYFDFDDSTDAVIVDCTTKN